MSAYNVETVRERRNMSLKREYETTVPLSTDEVNRISTSSNDQNKHSTIIDSRKDEYTFQKMYARQVILFENH